MLLCGLCCELIAGGAGTLRGQTPGLMTEHGVYIVHLLLHRVGTEEYSIREMGGGVRQLRSNFEINDRGTKRTDVSTLTMSPDLVPMRLEEVKTRGSEAEVRSVTEVKGGLATVREGDVSRDVARPAVAYVGFGPMPAALEMVMMRYWKLHRQPARLPILRADAKALPLEIRMVGHDTFEVKGQFVRLTRYTIANLVFGREVLWMNDSGRIAAVMTFAGGLPQEELLDEYEPVAAELEHSGVQQEMLDLDDLRQRVKPELTGTFAIVGARLIDGTGRPAVENAVVVVRDGRIAAAGAAGVTRVPAGVRVVHAEGRSLLPGLWEMHVHFSGVEFGPALLAAGVTTARDCGGEFEFLTTVRRKMEREQAPGPRLLLAGLIDSGGPLAFGWVDVRSAAAAVAAVDMYADAGFEQIKVYTQLTAEMLKAIAVEAHRRGLTVTGHVPAALDAFAGIADGMDQINHLQFVIRAMNPDGGTGPVNLGSERSKRLIALLREKEIVVDPTAGWGEMAGHPKDVAVASFEPGIAAAPDTLASRFDVMGVAAAEEPAFRERRSTDLKVIGALFRAGVPIVAGSDTGLTGYGLDREMELYVKAGMTPMEAIESATIVPARAMKMDGETGSVEVGKRADLVLVEGDPLRNISDVRRVESVVKDGRMYDSKALGRSVGFNR